MGDINPGHIITAIGAIALLLAFGAWITGVKVGKDRTRKESDEWFT